MSIAIKGTGTTKISVTGSTGADLDIGGWYAEYADGATYGTPKPITNQKPTTATTTTIIAGTGSTTSQVLKELSIANIDASLATVVTVNVNDGSTTITKYVETLQPGDILLYEDKKGWYLKSAATYSLVKQLTGDQSNSTVTPTKVTGLDVTNLPAGTYEFDYYILYQAAAATTGVRFDVNFTGTVTHFVWNQMFVGLIATASDANADQDAILSTASVYNAFASRAKGTAGRGTTLSVDTLASDMLMRIEGLMIVTVAGNLELWHGSEVAFQSTVMAGSMVIVTKAP